MKLLITIFAILLAATVTTAAKVEKKVDKKLNLAKEKRESQTGSSYLYLPPTGSGSSHGIGSIGGGYSSHGIGSIGGSSHGAGVSFGHSNGGLSGGGHAPVSFSHGGGAGIGGGLGGHGPTVDTYIIEQVGGHLSGGGSGSGRGHFGGGGAGFGGSYGHSKYITSNLGGSIGGGHHYNVPTVVIPSHGHGLSNSLGYSSGFAHGGLSSIGGGYSNKHLGQSNGLIGSGYSYSSGGFGGNHGGASSSGGFGGNHGGASSLGGFGGHHGGSSSLGGLGGHGGGFGGYHSGISSFAGLGGHSSGVSTSYGVPYVSGHGGQLSQGGSHSSVAGSTLGSGHGISYQNYDLYSGGNSGGSFGGHSGSLGESQISLGGGGGHQSYVIPTGSYGVPLAPPINSYTPAHVSSALSFGSGHDGGTTAISSAGNTFGYEAPQYAAGHKGLRHYHSGENQHAVIESKPVALTGGSELHTSISPSQAPFKPSAFLGATHESSGSAGLAQNYGAPAVQQEYRIETQEYSVPAQEYGAPSGSGHFGGSYENANSGYSGGAVDSYSHGGSYTQGTGFGVTGNHGSPSGSYLPPSSSGLPANSYLPPSSSYGAPSSHH